MSRTLPYLTFNEISVERKYQKLISETIHQIERSKSYLINCPVQMDGGGILTMNTDYISSSFDKVWHSLLRFYNHLQCANFTLEKIAVDPVLREPIKILRIYNTKCTSKGRSVTGRKASTTRGPMVMFGTKRPSITSTWIQSQPASSTAFT